MMSLIMFISSLFFNHNPNYHPKKKPPEDVVCGMSESEYEYLAGPSDRNRHCNGRTQKYYGKKIIYFKDGFLVGEVNYKDWFMDCMDLNKTSDFKSYCEEKK